MFVSTHTLKDDSSYSIVWFEMSYNSYGDGEGPGSLVPCSPWVRRVRRDWVTEQHELHECDSKYHQFTDSFFGLGYLITLLNANHPVGVYANEL